MTYRQLLEALQALPQDRLDCVATASFSQPGEGPIIFPVERIADAGELLRGSPVLGMMGDDLPILTGNRKR